MELTEDTNVTDDVPAKVDCGMSVSASPSSPSCELSHGVTNTVDARSISSSNFSFALFFDVATQGSNGAPSLGGHSFPVDTLVAISKVAAPQMMTGTPMGQAGAPKAEDVSGLVTGGSLCCSMTREGFERVLLRRSDAPDEEDDSVGYTLSAGCCRSCQELTGGGTEEDMKILCLDAHASLLYKAERQAAAVAPASMPTVAADDWTAFPPAAARLEAAVERRHRRTVQPCGQTVARNRAALLAAAHLACGSSLPPAV